MKAEAQDVSNRLFLPKRLEKPTVGSLELEPHPLTLPVYLFTTRTWATPTPTLILLPSCGTQDPSTHSPSSECSCLLSGLPLKLQTGLVWECLGQRGGAQSPPELSGSCYPRGQAKPQAVSLSSEISFSVGGGW